MLHATCNTLHALDGISYFRFLIVNMQLTTETYKQTYCQHATCCMKQLDWFLLNGCLQILSCHKNFGVRWLCQSRFVRRKLWRHEWGLYPDRLSWKFSVDLSTPKFVVLLCESVSDKCELVWIRMALVQICWIEWVSANLETTIREPSTSQASFQVWAECGNGCHWSESTSPAQTKSLRPVFLSPQQMKPDKLPTLSHGRRPPHS